MSFTTSPPNRPAPSSGSEPPAQGRGSTRLVRPRLRRRRNRRLWGFAALLALAAGGFAFYKYWTRPVQVTAAVVEDATGEVAVLNAYARYFAQTKTALRMTVQTYKTRGEVADAFLAKKADLAVARAETNLLGRASVIAVMNKNIGIVVSLDPRIDEISKLRGKRVGLYSPGGAADSFYAALMQTYDLKDGDIQLVRADPETLASLAADKKIDALVTSTPLVSRRSGDPVRALLRQKKIKLKLLPIDHADELIRRAPAFESYDVPEKTFGEFPEEETKAVDMPTNLVAQSTMPNDVAAALARQFLSNKQAVNAEAPSAAQIAAPDTDKDAFVRIHPGVAAYIDNEELTFFDKYGDLIYIAAMVGGVFASGFVALRRSFGPDTEADACDLIDQLVDLRHDARELSHSGDRAAIGLAWRDLSERFETMLAHALPLIADGAVGDRTVQALATALTAAESAIADLALMAFGVAQPRRRAGAAVVHPAGESGIGAALSDL